MKILVHRPMRRTAVVTPQPVDDLAAPPQLPSSAAGGFPVQTLLPVLGAVSSMVMMIVSRGSNPVYLLVGALVFVVALASGLAMTLTQRSRATKQRQLNRERYLDYLEDTQASMQEKAGQVRSAALISDPAPQVLPQIAANPERVWERRPEDDDFLRVRVGTGNVAWFYLQVPKDANPVQPVDPLMLQEAVDASRTDVTVEDMPIWIDLSTGGDIAIIGSPGQTANLARAIIGQAACFHAPSDVKMAAVLRPDMADQYPGINMLPHTQAAPLSDGTPQYFIAAATPDLMEMLAADLTARIRQVAAKRHAGSSAATALDLPKLVIFIDEHGRPSSPLPLPEDGYSCADLGITVVHLVDRRLDEPSHLDVRVTLDDTGGIQVEDLRRTGDHSRIVIGQADIATCGLFDAVMRAVALLTFSSAEAEKSSAAPAVVSAMRLLGIDDLDTFSLHSAWQPRTSRDFLRIPIGVDDHGAPLLLDIKEAAQLGMGPHGICVGATGSGKSELLRTLVLSLATRHSPEDLSMILVDYKGGAAFAPFASLPHVAGLMDNLADDPQLIRRARESISGEVLRRQELLKDANSAASISHYRQMRLDNPAMPPMPHLLLVIDEFGELLTAEPEFSALLLQIGRIGRSIGVHLLLASQRIEGGMLRGIDTYLSYWIGMRTFSEAESRTILDTPDAFTLPAAPGWGYLKVDTSIYTRFRAGYVSSPIEAAQDNPAEDEAVDAAPLVQLVPMFSTETKTEVVTEEQAVMPDVGHLLVDKVVEHLGAGTKTAPVWLPPLQTRVTLGRVLNDARLGESQPTLGIPVGILDNPAKQQQRPWVVDLTAKGGHIAMIGAPQTGRSTFLRTLAVSAALTHTPKQLSIYGIDLTGGGLDRLEGFPHVGGIATRSDRSRLNRLFEELHTMLALREEVFRTHHIDSPAALRAAHEHGQIPELVAPDVIVLVDGVEPLRNELDQLDAPFTELLQRGGTFGIHLVIAVTRWNELRTSAQPLIGQRFEFRLNDPSDSTIQRAAAEVLKSAGPGRALTQDRLYGQIALPMLDEIDDDAQIGDAIADLAHRSTQAWSGPSAEPIRLLPDNLDPADLPDEFDEPNAVPYGLRQDTFAPVTFDPALDQHLLVFGDTQCGKTTLLRGIAQQFMKRLTPDELVFAVIDSRNTLAQNIPDAYLGGLAATANDAKTLSAAVAHELDNRHANPSGSMPRVIVLVDDYDIISAGGTHPLEPLLPYLPSARDLKLSIILARPVSGAGRAAFEPTIQAIRDTGGTGLLMSGDRSEGAVFPKVYPEQLPPGRGKLVRRGTGPRIIQIANFTQVASKGARHAA